MQYVGRLGRNRTDGRLWDWNLRLAGVNGIVIRAKPSAVVLGADFTIAAWIMRLTHVCHFIQARQDSTSGL